MCHPRVAVSVEGGQHLVDVRPDRRVERDLVSGPECVEMTERLAEAGSVPGDRDVAVLAGERGVLVMTGAGAQRVAADALDDDHVDLARGAGAHAIDPQPRERAADL